MSPTRRPGILISLGVVLGVVGALAVVPAGASTESQPSDPVSVLSWWASGAASTAPAEVPQRTRGPLALLSRRPSATPSPSPTPTPTPSASSQPSADDASSSSATSASDTPAGYPFGPHSVWRSDVSGAAVADDSSAMVQYLVGTITDRYNGVAAFNAHAYNTTYYVANADTPRTDVRYVDCQGKGSVPAGLLGEFRQVPIPDGAHAADGSDGELTVYSPSTDQLWELWQAQRTDDGWQACWGGRLDSVSSSAGYFTGGFGATATGLPNAAGMVSLADIASGSIEHAVALQIPNPASWSKFVYPAQRSDGWDGSSRALPEGSRLRLAPSVDVAALHLGRVASMIAVAAQKYGFIVTDKSGAVSVVAQEGRWQSASDPDPWTRIDGTSNDSQVLAGFPWSRLQVVSGG